MENWKTIDELNPQKIIYQISDHGNVRSINFKTGKSRVLLQSLTHRGYKTVGLMSDDGRHYLPVHRLVGKYFIAKARCKPQINHKDCDKTNNVVENLEWVTRSQNVKHAVINRRFPSGENQHKAVFTNIQVIEIKQRKLNGENARQISNAMNVRYENVKGVLYGNRYKYVEAF